MIYLAGIIMFLYAFSVFGLTLYANCLTKIDDKKYKEYKKTGKYPISKKPRHWIEF